MTGPPDEHALLLAAPDLLLSRLARNLLEEAGIPTLAYGLDIGIGDLGETAHSFLTRPDIYVPKAALEHARALLTEALGPNDAWKPRGAR